MDKGKPLTFVSLEIENVLRLTAFKMTMGPDGVIVIEAKNGQGKSSALDAFEMAMAGMSDAPPEPLHDGTKKGYIVATFDGITVKRVFRASKPPALTVTLPDGTKVSSPQTFLDALFTRRCLRPTKLMDASEKEQVEIVSEIMGFDPSEFNAEIESVFNDRTDANREAKRLAAVVTETTFHEDAPDEEVSVSALMTELQKRQAHNASIDDKHHEVAEAERHVTDADVDVDCAETDVGGTEERISMLEEEIAQYRRDLETEIRPAVETAKTAREEATRAVDGIKDELAAMKLAKTNEIAAQIEAADDTNRKVRANVERAKAKGVATEAAKDAGALDAKLAELKDARTAARLEARDRLSIPGLDLTEDRLLFNGVPFSQAGDSAQLRVCVEVAIKGNKDKRIRVLLIDNGEKLDADGVEAVMAAAQKPTPSYHVIMTKVIARTEDASESSIVIEDGANA